MTKITINGHEYDAAAVANLMDDEIREDLHSRNFDSEQAFVDAYLAAHRAKFGEEFTVN